MIYLTVLLAVLLAGTLYTLYIITATLVLTQRDRDRQRTLYQDAIDALAQRQADLDARDAEIERLYGACKYFVEQDQNKHRLWREAVHAGERAPFVRQMTETIRHAQDMRRAQWEN